MSGSLKRSQRARCVCVSQLTAVIQESDQQLSYILQPLSLSLSFPPCPIENLLLFTHKWKLPDWFMTKETNTSLNTNYIFSVKITSCSLRSYLKSKTNMTVTMWSCERKWNHAEPSGIFLEIHQRCQNPKSPCVNKKTAYTANTHTHTLNTDMTVLCVWESACVIMRRWGQWRPISTLTHFNSEHRVQWSWWKQTHTHTRTSIIVRKFINNAFTSPEVCEKNHVQWQN